MVHFSAIIDLNASERNIEQAFIKKFPFATENWG